MIPHEAWAVEVEHRVKGSPDTVFSYFVDPEKYRRWKGADAELDPRPGGVYKVTMAPGVCVLGHYIVVDPPRRLVVTWGWDADIELPQGLAVVKPRSSTVEFSFTPDGEETIVRVRHLGIGTEKARWAHELGWRSYLPRLASLLDRGDPGPDPSQDLGQTYYAADDPVPTAGD